MDDRLRNQLELRKWRPGAACNLTGIPAATVGEFVVREMAVAIASQDWNLWTVVLCMTCDIEDAAVKADTLGRLLLMRGHRVHQEVAMEIQQLGHPSSVAVIRQILERGFDDFAYTGSGHETIAKWFSHALRAIGTPQAVDLLREFTHSRDAGLAAGMIYRLSRMDLPVFLPDASSPADEGTQRPSESIVHAPTLHVLFEYLPTLDQQSLENGLWELREYEVGPILLIEQRATLEGFEARLSIGPHRLHLVGCNAPAPTPALERALAASHWREPDTAPLREHAAHVVCRYESGSADRIEQVIACHLLVRLFGHSGLVGVIDTEAAVCLPAVVIDALLEDDSLDVFRGPLPAWLDFRASARAT